MKENQKYFFPCVLDLIHLLEQKLCRDCNLWLNTMFENMGEGNQDLKIGNVIYG